MLDIPLGHTIPAHKAFGWCAYCPDRSVAEELAAWQTREPAAKVQQIRDQLADARRCYEAATLRADQAAAERDALSDDLVLATSVSDRHRDQAARHRAAWQSARRRAKERGTLDDLHQSRYWCLRRAERAEAALDRVRALHQPLASYPNPDMTTGTITICAGCEDANSQHPCNTLAALDDPAATEATDSPTRHVHVTITNPDPYTANRAALALVDWVRAEFDGYEVTTDAREWDTTAETGGQG